MKAVNWHVMGSSETMKSGRLAGAKSKERDVGVGRWRWRTA